MELFPVVSTQAFWPWALGEAKAWAGGDRRFPDAKFAYLLELKHVKTGASEEEIGAARAAAQEQIERYLSDGSLLPALMGERAIKAVALVFIGAKGYRCWEVRTVGERTGPHGVATGGL